MHQNLKLVVFPDGVGIRNYLYSGALEKAGEELMLFHNFSSQTIDYLKTVKNIAGDVTIPEYKESFREKFLRELISLTRLQHNAKICDNPSILYNWKTNHGGFAKNLFYKSIELTARLYSDYNSILNLEKKYQRAIRTNPFYKQVRGILEELQPAWVYCTHQRGLKMATIFAAAADLGIPTTTVIYSWDNLPKARLALRADRYEVWSEYMKSEFATFYPEIPQDAVKVSGTPQFSFYNNPDFILSADRFFSQYDLDPSKKIICFSGDDQKTSPDDPKYLRDIAEALVEGRLTDTYQILLRPCPTDKSGRFDAVVKDFSSVIKLAAPLWNTDHNSWTRAYPSLDDVSLLVSTAYYSDLVINVGSTMIFDFRMFNKPCIFINYDQKQQVNPQWSVQKIYTFQHFRSMPSESSVVWLSTKDEITDKIVNINRYYDADASAAWLKKIVSISPVI